MWWDRLEVDDIGTSVGIVKWSQLASKMQPGSKLGHHWKDVHDPWISCERTIMVDQIEMDKSLNEFMII